MLNPSGEKRGLYYRVKSDASTDAEPVKCTPGGIIPCDDPMDVKFFYKPPVPDPGHQSSLDYLKGV